jgi:hypothetical protein
MYCTNAPSAANGIARAWKERCNWAAAWSRGTAGGHKPDVGVNGKQGVAGTLQCSYLDMCVWCVLCSAPSRLLGQETRPHMCRGWRNMSNVRGRCHLLAGWCCKRCVWKVACLEPTRPHWEAPAQLQGFVPGRGAQGWCSPLVSPGADAGWQQGGSVVSLGGGRLEIAGPMMQQGTQQAAAMTPHIQQPWCRCDGCAADATAYLAGPVKVGWPLAGGTGGSEWPLQQLCNMTLHHPAHRRHAPVLPAAVVA